MNGVKTEGCPSDGASPSGKRGYDPWSESELAIHSCRCGHIAQLLQILLTKTLTFRIASEETAALWRSVFELSKRHTDELYRGMPGTKRSKGQVSCITMRFLEHFEA